MKIFTIGFTKKSARDFFGKLTRPEIKRLVDVRLNNVSQLSGFAKKDDLRFFTEAICHIEYLHLPELAPTKEMLDTYRKGKGGWQDYEKQFLDLMSSRQVENKVQKETIDGGCLLCSEEKPDRCHRRLVAEYLEQKWGDVEIVHIV
jgi:uncharacterized protein (DUF488 family)